MRCSARRAEKRRPAAAKLSGFGWYQAPQTGAQTNFFQPAYAPAAKGPKEKRPVNKKLLFIGGGAVLAVILAIVLIVSLVGGNKASDDPNVGLWNAVTASMWEMDRAGSDLFEEGVTLELKGKQANACSTLTAILRRKVEL